MLKRILAVGLSSIILALCISLISYIPEEQREPNIYYMSVSESFIFTLYFSLIFYAILGIPFSWAIDKWRKRYSNHSIAKQYLQGIGLYSLAGIISGTVFYTSIGYIQFFLGIYLRTIAFWFVASILYFHILWILEKKLLKKMRYKKEKLHDSE